MFILEDFLEFYRYFYVPSSNLEAFRDAYICCGETVTLLLCDMLRLSNLVISTK
jgi:hypothetical protein